MTVPGREGERRLNISVSSFCVGSVMDQQAEHVIRAGNRGSVEGGALNIVCEFDAASILDQETDREATMRGVRSPSSLAFISAPLSERSCMGLGSPELSAR